VPPRSTLVLLAALLYLAAFTWTKVQASPETEPVFLYTTATHYEPLAWMRGGERFPAGAAIILHDAAGHHAFVPDFVASADPAVSSDGQSVLFAGKHHPQDPWQVFAVAVSGGEPRRITFGPEDCIRPFYLPDDRIVYARKIGGRFVIEALDLAGGKPLALTYGPANFLPTDILRDGRILFEAGYPLGTEATPELYTIYSDGSGVESYRCDHGHARYQGRQIESGDVVFASQSGLARFTSARAREVLITAPTGEYSGDIVEVASGDWMLSWRPNAKANFQLMLWSPGSARLRLVFAVPNFDLLDPVPVAAKASPNRHPSGLHDWPNANLLCLNAYTSKYSFAAGAIRTARVYTRGDSGEPKLLGTAPVERDGSFFVHVPSDQPLQIELLDAAGKTLKREAGFFWMRRGEQRACVGCHAGPETSPENAVPMILLKSTTPADMTGGDAPKAAGGH